MAARAAPETWSDLAGRWLQPLRESIDAMRAPGLLRSYAVRDGADATEFDRAHQVCAYVYDNAVAGLALLAAGDAPRATRIAEALATAQGADRFWHDGRLRNAYAAGMMTAPAKLSGWWDAGRGAWLEDGYQAGSATGVAAWAMLLWTALGPAFRAECERAADWIETTQGGGAGFTGGFIGHEPSPERMTWTSTEQNLDCAVVFSRLHRPSAVKARDFVAGMWDATQGRFLSGLTPDGVRNRHSAVDANVWPLLAGDAAHVAALAWVLTRHGLPSDAPHETVDGVDFDTDRDGIWLEGTAIAALALRERGDTVQAARFAATLAANTAPSGLIYACTTERLTTGLSTGLDAASADFFYYRRPHVAPTAWAVMAALNFNPLR